MDFVTTTKALSYSLEFKIKTKHQYKVFCINSLRNPYKYSRDLVHLIKSRQYDIVHIHKNSLANILPIIIAKICGVSKVIVHSHNTRPGLYRKIAFLLHKFNVHVLSHLNVQRLACSNLAGNWMFGTNNYTVVHNAIDIDGFVFNKKIRREVRQELQLDNKFVVGNVARITYQKNQLFLLKVFSQIVKMEENSILLLVGGNDNTDEGKKYYASLQKQIRLLHLADKVKFLGIRADSDRLYQAMDVFILPSHYEGLGISAIEAQASGLYCLCSDVLPDETNISKNFHVLSLGDSVEKWARVAFQSGTLQRADMRDAIKSAGYGMNDEVMKIESIYREIS